MKLRYKPCAAALALVLVVVPAMALGSCQQDMPGMSDSDMVGMMMSPSGTYVSALPNVSCCVFVPAEITASSWLPESDSAAAIVPSGSVPSQDFTSITETISTPSFLAATPPTQAILCVFLI